MRTVLARTSDKSAFLKALLCATKKRTRQWVRLRGAEKRIRTSGTFQAHTRFPIVLLKPLRHLCIQAYLYYCIFQKKASVFVRVYEKSSKNLFLQKSGPFWSAFILLVRFITIASRAALQKARVRAAFANELRG